MTLYEYVSQDVQLRKCGTEYVGLCPFHQEKTPSFYVNPEKQFFYCFGCGAKGDAITYLRKHRGYTFAEAQRMVAGDPGWIASKPTTSEAVRQRVLLELKQDYTEWQQRHLNDIVQQYQEVIAERGKMEAVIERLMTIDRPDLVDRWHTEYNRLGLDEHMLIGAMDWWSSHATEKERIARWDREKQQGRGRHNGAVS